MKTLLTASSLFLFYSFSFGQHASLLPDSIVTAFHSELSGEAAKKNLEYIATLHRMRGSAEFKSAVTFIESRLKQYNLEEVETFQIPGDGKSMYGTQKSRLGWEAEFAELWEMQKSTDGFIPLRRIADYESMPIVLAEDSESGDVTSELIDVGAGTSEKDYFGKDVKGKLVLTSSSPSSVVTLAVGKYGAAGILSYAQNQKTAWWKEDVNLIRWGHFENFETVKSFCFMLSIKQATELQQRMSKGEKIVLHAVVKAGQHQSNYDFATAVIKGSDATLRNQEIVFTCHLDHQRPGANDNASGSMTILEIARTMKKLIDEGKLKRPLRTIRFMWSPEIEGTSALLSQRKGYAENVRAVIHMDMVGGGPVTKSVFHVAGAPMSLPSFVADVGQEFGRFVNSESDHYASGYDYNYTFTSREGGKEPLQAILGEFHLGSDHEVYSEGGYKIPAIYMHDWPDRYVHTNFDMPSNIDPTKLLRAGFIGGASGYYLANVTGKETEQLRSLVYRQALRRKADLLGRTSLLPKAEADQLLRGQLLYEQAVNSSIDAFAATAIVKPTDVYSKLFSELPKSTTKPSGKVYTRNPMVKGPMSVFGYSYFSDHYGEEKSAAIRIFEYNGKGEYYSYEALNFVDGKRTVSEIRDALSTELGPIPMDIVEEFLTALESIGVILSR